MFVLCDIFHILGSHNVIYVFKANLMVPLQLTGLYNLKSRNI